MTITQKSLLITQAVLSIILVAYLAWNAWRVRLEKSRYKLYVFRDDLIYLAATHKIEQDCQLFKTFYEVSNLFILNIKELKVSNVIKASLKTKKTLEHRMSVEVLIQQLQRSDPEVQERFMKFFRAMVEFLLDNSLWLKLLVWTHGIARNTAKSLDRLFGVSTRLSKQKEIYEAYTYFNDLNGALSA
jgi:hypothetical protein